jgi:UDP-MurNAc hydroxylase
MKITFIGHAGFCIETEHALVITDPWLSPTGAFDASWFQLPKNHHLAPLLAEKLALKKPAKFVYISHEHQDHYDRTFLDTLQERDFSVVIPRFRRPSFRRALADYRCKELITLLDGESLAFPGGEIKLYLDDSELNRDSALFIRADGETFLNLNDCRIFDRMREVAAKEGAVDVFTCQFSGASWHPTCYEYSKEDFDRISNQKVVAKFKMAESAIRVLKPRYFLPSAGPVCFIDPEMLDLNSTVSGIFRRAPEFLTFLAQAFSETGTQSRELLPGDILDVTTGAISEHGERRYDDSGFNEYVRDYSNEYADYFAERARLHSAVDPEMVFERFKEELEQKLKLLTLRERVSIPLYCGLKEQPGKWLRVDFQGGCVDQVAEIAEPNYYSFIALAWQIEKVINQTFHWEDFALSFRVKLKRVPDVYHPLIHAFLTLDKADLYQFCRMLIDLESRTERIEVTAGGKTYSVNRFCPHNGGDLKEGEIDGGHYLVCPRHRWCFDLENGGACTSNGSSIFAEEIRPTNEKPEESSVVVG